MCDRSSTEEHLSPKQEVVGSTPIDHAKSQKMVSLKFGCGCEIIYMCDKAHVINTPGFFDLVHDLKIMRS